MKIYRSLIQALLLLVLWSGLGPQVHAQTDTVTYVYTDPQGTLLAQADTSGNIIRRYDYAPYGNSVASLGGSPNGPGYTGHVNDPETGLVYMQQRYYDPGVGRFLSVDPVAAYDKPLTNFNRYTYADNNPYTNVDPDGRQSKIAWLIRLTASGMRRIARLTKEEAVQARRSGESILADRKQLARQIETAANGPEGQLRHVGHELKDGSKGLPHYQTEGEYGHSFWGKVSVSIAAIGVTLDKVAEAAEYIPDPTPHPATKDDLERSNKIIGAFNKTTGFNMPKYNTNIGDNSEFMGFFRIDGRIDSQKLAKDLDKKIRGY